MRTEFGLTSSPAGTPAGLATVELIRAADLEREAAKCACQRSPPIGLVLEPRGASQLTGSSPHVEPTDDRTAWRMQQMLVDVEGLNDWMAELEVDLAASREAGEPVLQLLGLESLV